MSVFLMVASTSSYKRPVISEHVQYHSNMFFEHQFYPLFSSAYVVGFNVVVWD